MQFYQKDTLTQVLSSEYCEVFKNTYFEKYLQTAASDRVGSYNVKIYIIETEFGIRYITLP